jgi:hypothetical protein
MLFYIYYLSKKGNMNGTSQIVAPVALMGLPVAMRVKARAMSISNYSIFLIAKSSNKVPLKRN